MSLKVIIVDLLDNDENLLYIKIIKWLPSEQ